MSNLGLLSEAEDIQFNQQCALTTLGIIQSIGPKTAAVLAVSQSITVQIDQCIRFHSYIPAFQTYGGMRPVGSLGRADATPGKIGR